MRGTLAIALALSLLSPLGGGAARAEIEGGADGLARRALEQAILPGYAAFRAEAETLKAPAAACDADGLRGAYHQAYDAWLAVEPIAFGPAERGDRRFAILFWPDAKGFVAKALGRLERAEDPAALAPETFARASVALRGFPALERLLWTGGGPQGFDGGEGAFRCRIAQAIAAELARTAGEIEAEWRAPDGPAAALLAPAAHETAQRSEADVTRDLFRSVDGALEKNAALRIGRPLGGFGEEKPRRAESWRSGRSSRNIRISLAALERFVDAVFAPELRAPDRAALAADFQRARVVIERMPDSFEATLGDPQSRLAFEAARSRLEGLRESFRKIVAPALGVTAGFNSLDGD